MQAQRQTLAAEQVVVTDIVMPAMSGVKLAEQIRAAHPDQTDAVI